VIYKVGENVATDDLEYWLSLCVFFCDTLCSVYVIYKVGENVATDDLEYWLAPESTTTSVVTLPGGADDSTKEQIGPDNNDQSAAVSLTIARF